ncbi:MAG: oligosaccharide flippase family protein [Bacteroidia bacterium]|nr:oligosaccharide flippase family protein [Bacteroidia bacterium]
MNYLRMQKKFITNLAFLLFINFLIKPFWIFGIDRTVQNVVGSDIYGLYYALFNFSFMFNIFLDLGITNFNNRNISQHSQLLSKHFPGIIALRSLLAIGYFLISISVAYLIGYRFEELSLLLVLLFNQVLASFILYFRSNISGLQLYRTDSILSTLDRFIMILICSMLLWGNLTGGTFKIEWFIYAQTVAYGLTALIAFGIAAAKAQLKAIRWNKLFFLLILKKSAPFAILILLMAFYNRMDAVMIERLIPDGAEQAGVYAQAYRLLDAANMIAFLFAGLLLPMFSHLIAKKESVNRLIELSFSLIATIAITAIAICSIYNYELMDLLYFEHSAQSAEILAILMISFFAMSTTYIYGTLLTANGSLKALNIMALGGLLLNLLLNFILIPKYLAYGAAVATLITQAATAIAQVFIARSIFDFKFKMNNILKIITFLVITVSASFALKNWNDQWILMAVISIIIALVSAVALRLIDLKAIKEVLSIEQEN